MLRAAYPYNTCDITIGLHYTYMYTHVTKSDARGLSLTDGSGLDRGNSFFVSFLNKSSSFLRRVDGGLSRVGLRDIELERSSW